MDIQKIKSTWQKIHVEKFKFKEKFNLTQHKGRRVPLLLLERVEKELEN